MKIKTTDVIATRYVTFHKLQLPLISFRISLLCYEYNLPMRVLFAHKTRYKTGQQNVCQYRIIDFTS